MFSNINNFGRYGNQFVRNMIGYILCEKYNTYYKFEGDFEKLGIIFKLNNSLINDSIINNNKIYKCNINLFLNNNEEIDMSGNYIFSSYCQNIECIRLIIQYYNKLDNVLCKSIILNNKYKDRYNNNNDIFVHVRDSRPAEKIIPTWDFYETVLNNLTESKEIGKIYLSSDNINKCKNLIDKYKMTVYNSSKEDTILFGSTCKYIILCSGSYSLMIGLFGFYSECIFFSKFAGQTESSRHHPDYYPEFLQYSKYKMI